MATTASAVVVVLMVRAFNSTFKPNQGNFRSHRIILLVLWVPLDQFAPRINASISGLVGILVYHMSQKNSFPKVGYTMVADYYFLRAYALVVAMIIGIVFTQTLMSKGKKDEAKKWNFRFSIGSAIAAVGVYSFMTLSTI